MEDTTYFLVWRTANRQFTIEGLFDSLDKARAWVKATMDERHYVPRGNWIVSYAQPERWSLVTSGGVFRVAPATMNAAMINTPEEA